MPIKGVYLLSTQKDGRKLQELFDRLFVFRQRSIILQHP